MSAYVWLERHVNAQMGGQVIPFLGGDPTFPPRACQAEVVGALAPNVDFPEVTLLRLLLVMP
jgi:hypothetical protein